jgi:hypothetical protein
MAYYNELPVYKATYDLLLEMFRFTKDFAKEYQYTVGESLTCLIHVFSLMQMRGIGTCRHSCLFQAFRNEAGALK